MKKLILISALLALTVGCSPDDGVSAPETVSPQVIQSFTFEAYQKRTKVYTNETDAKKGAGPLAEMEKVAVRRILIEYDRNDATIAITDAGVLEIKDVITSSMTKIWTPTGYFEKVYSPNTAGHIRYIRGRTETIYYSH